MKSISNETVRDVREDAIYEAFATSLWIDNDDRPGTVLDVIQSRGSPSVKFFHNQMRQECIGVWFELLEASSNQSLGVGTEKSGAARRAGSSWFGS